MARTGARDSPVREFPSAGRCRSSRGLLYVCLVDATLAWTVVGSAAGVVGVGVTVGATVIQSRSGRTARPEVTAELAHGQLGEDGVLCVGFASGETNVILVPKPGETETDADRKPRKKARRNLESKPVNAIFIRNHGQTPNGLALSDHMRAEQVKLDFPGDVGDAGLAGLAGREVAGFLGLAGAGPVRAVPDEGGGGVDLQQERGEREIGLLRGKKPRRCRSRRPGRAGS